MGGIVHPLSSGQFYSPGTVFREHRTKPELPCVCGLATIRLSCPLLTRVRGRGLLPTSPWQRPKKLAGARRYDGRKQAGAITPRPSASPSKRRALLVLDPYLAVDSKVPSVALALELVVITCWLANGSSLRSQHITPARWVRRIEHYALIRRPRHFTFLEVREIELTSRQRDAI
jgi:hypothetical protein